MQQPKIHGTEIILEPPVETGSAEIAEQAIKALCAGLEKLIRMREVQVHVTKCRSPPGRTRREQLQVTSVILNGILAMPVTCLTFRCLERIWVESGIEGQARLVTMGDILLYKEASGAAHTTLQELLTRVFSTSDIDDACLPLVILPYLVNRFEKCLDMFCKQYDKGSGPWGFFRALVAERPDEVMKVKQITLLQKDQGSSFKEGSISLSSNYADSPFRLGPGPSNSIEEIHAGYKLGPNGMEGEVLNRMEVIAKSYPALSIIDTSRLLSGKRDMKGKAPSEVSRGFTYCSWKSLDSAASEHERLHPWLMMPASTLSLMRPNSSVADSSSQAHDAPEASQVSSGPKPKSGPE